VIRDSRNTGLARQCYETDVTNIEDTLVEIQDPAVSYNISSWVLPKLEQEEKKEYRFQQNTISSLLLFQYTGEQVLANPFSS
jgi:hypothetical protein